MPNETSLQSIRARQTAVDATAHTEDDTTQGPTTTDVVETEAQSALDILEDFATKAAEVAQLVSPAREAISLMKKLKADLTRIAAVTASGAAGGRFVPKPRQSLEDFVAESTAKDPNFDIDVWRQQHESDLRRDFPDRFTGKGWGRDKGAAAVEEAPDIDSVDDGDA